MRNLFISLIVSALIATSLSQCARPVEPHGGPKDTLSPIVLRSVPAQFSKNVAEKKMEINFNEYVTLKDFQKEFYVSPALEKNPTIKEKGRKIQVEFEKPLEPNTTYSLNFGNSLVDVNENNPIRDFNYIFSTGDRLDTSRFNGIVYDAASMMPIKDAYVFFYENDSVETPLKHKPNVISKTDKEGVFIANNLKNRKYKVIAIKDLNGNYLFDPGFDLIAFDKDLIAPVYISSKPDSIKDSVWRAQLPPQVKLKMFAETKTRQYLAGKARQERYKFSLYFNAPNPEIKKLELKDFELGDFIVDPDRESDTITYWLKDATRILPDTIKAELTYMKSDSTGKLVEFVEKVNLELPLAKINQENAKKKKEDKDKKDNPEKSAATKIPTITPSFEAPDGSVNSEGGLFMKFGTPLIAMDTAKFSLYLEDENDKRIPKPFTIKPVKRSILSYKIESKWVEDSKYLLVIDSNAVKNTLHYTNDSIGYTFTTSNTAKYGSFIINMQGVTHHVVVQILDSKYKVIRQKTVDSDGIITFAYIKPEKYYIRLIEDLNNNDEWDTGNYLEQRQPERVAFVTKDKEKLFQLRSGWENELTIDVNETFSNN